jgi:5-methylcytosine-specific restriction protein A
VHGKAIFEGIGGRLCVMDGVYRQALAITSQQWIELLQDESVFKEKDVALVSTLYRCKGYKETASNLAKLLGEISHSPLNSQVGRLGKRIVKKLIDVEFPSRKDGSIRYWHIPFWGEKDKYGFIWELRPELQEAIRIIENAKPEILSKDVVLPQELGFQNMELYEGNKKLVAVNRYERNIKARQLCLMEYGFACSVCGFDFEEMYGEIGSGYIEVHHLKPLHEIKKEYQVDPVNDLRPVCPNCHAMLHKANLSIEELKAKIKGDRYNSIP